MEQEYPFRPRGRHGFDREDVIGYISQAQQRCNDHLAHLEELESAKNAWYTQAKGLEREKAALMARNQELEEQLERGAVPAADGDDWFSSDPLLSAFSPAEAQQSAALKSRCLELEDQLRLQQERQQRLAQDLAAARSESAVLREENQTIAHELESREAREAETLPRVTMHQQENEALLGRLEQQNATVQSYIGHVAVLEQEKVALTESLAVLEQEKAALAESLAVLEAIKGEKANLERYAAALESEKTALESALAAQKHESAALATEQAALRERLASLEHDKAAYQEQMPVVQAQLTHLAESAEQISTLKAVKEGLEQELGTAREQSDAQARELTALNELLRTARQEKDVLVQKTAALANAEAAARQQQTSLAEETRQLHARIADLEANSAEKNEETLRSMVLASFNYSNLYVDNNLKTAQFISDATSRNIGRVSDSANSLLEQLESIGRSFNDTTDNIRRNLAAFQRELGSIQSGMNRRLSQDRFKTLLEENERLRNRLETELLAELNEEDEDPLPSPEGAAAPHLPFSEDLPQSYHEYLD
ncbi:MAG: hypothetical protein LBB50_01415 [Oscillospiraceae bacterium]|jgi:chromosome segregation ATPase|nr:hypothetical protein [Oscillospiraceae bacterium]